MKYFILYCSSIIQSIYTYYGQEQSNLHTSYLSDPHHLHLQLRHHWKKKINKFGLGPLACSDSELDFWNLWIYFWTFGRTP